MFTGRWIVSLFVAGLGMLGCNGGGGGGDGGSDGSTLTGCPADPPRAEKGCGGTQECTYEVADVGCPSKLPVYANCVDQLWEVWRPTTCEALPAQAACDPTGKWSVTTTGPYDPPDSLFEQDTKFTLEMIRKPDRLVYMKNFHGHLSSDGCTLSANYSGPESCSEHEGESFCSWIETAISLDLSTDPATGTVNESCWGECGGNSTAPVEATKAP